LRPATTRVRFSRIRIFPVRLARAPQFARCIFVAPETTRLLQETAAACPQTGSANPRELRMRGSYPVSARKKTRGRLVTYQHSEMQQLEKCAKAPVMFKEM